MTEADTCRELVTPKRVAAGWGTSESVLGEQHSFTNGRIIVAGGKVRRGKQRRADYLLYYQRDMPLAVVEAKEVGLPAETGVQQAREYAEMLGLKFAYWSLASKTMRTARSITSGENFGDFLMLAHCQAKEPPQNPGRFKLARSLLVHRQRLWAWGQVRNRVSGA